MIGFVGMLEGVLVVLIECCTSIRAFSIISSVGCPGVSSKKPSYTAYSPGRCISRKVLLMKDDTPGSDGFGGRTASTNLPFERCFTLLDYKHSKGLPYHRFLCSIPLIPQFCQMVLMPSNSQRNKGKHFNFLFSPNNTIE